MNEDRDSADVRSRYKTLLCNVRFTVRLFETWRFWCLSSRVDTTLYDPEWQRHLHLVHGHLLCINVWKLLQPNNAKNKSKQVLNLRNFVKDEHVCRDIRAQVQAWIEAYIEFPDDQVFPRVCGCSTEVTWTCPVNRLNWKQLTSLRHKAIAHLDLEWSEDNSMIESVRIIELLDLFHQIERLLTIVVHGDESARDEHSYKRTEAAGRYFHELALRNQLNRHQR